MACAWLQGEESVTSSSTDERPLVTIVVPVWNRSEAVMEAVRSVLDQTLKSIEVIVVDDGSTDETPDRISTISDPRLSLIRRQHDGVGSARNAGASRASGTFLIFLDSDDQALPTWLDSLCRAQREADADIAICGVHLIERDGSTSNYLPDPQAAAPDDLIPHFLAGTVLIRRELFLACGGYDPTLEFGENSELAVRLLTSEHPAHVVVVPEPLLRVRLRNAPVNTDARVRGAELVLERHQSRCGKMPATWSSYNTLVGAARAREGLYGAAARHFTRALISSPNFAGLARLVMVSIPPLARRAWSRPSPCPSVLFIVLAPGIGGSVRSLASLLRRIHGVRRIVARRIGTSTSQLISANRLADETVDLALPSGQRIGDRLRATVAITRQAWRARDDLVAIHANGLAELNLALLPALLTRTRVVVWVHEWQVPPFSRQIAFFLRHMPLIRFAAVSRSNLEMLFEARLAKPNRASIVVNPIDLLDIKAPRSTVGTRFRVGYLGTPARYKGFHLLPDLVRLTSAAPVEWTIHAGPESLMSDTFAELRALGVKLPGKTSEVREAYARCDLVVVPSLEESFGRVAAEAMANGIPVVASDLPSLRILLGDEDAGILVPPGDVTAMADAVVRLVEDPQLRHRLGAAGGRRAERFDPDAVARTFLDLYGVR